MAKASGGCVPCGQHRLRLPQGVQLRLASAQSVGRKSASRQGSRRPVSHAMASAAVHPSAVCCAGSAPKSRSKRNTPGFSGAAIGKGTSLCFDDRQLHVTRGDTPSPKRPKHPLHPCNQPPVPEGSAPSAPCPQAACPPAPASAFLRCVRARVCSAVPMPGSPSTEAPARSVNHSLCGRSTWHGSPACTTRPARAANAAVSGESCRSSCSARCSDGPQGKAVANCLCRRHWRERGVGPAGPSHPRVTWAGSAPYSRRRRIFSGWPAAALRGRIVEAGTESATSQDKGVRPA
jgi:hypothetical protein